jgi:predicted RNA-binding protein (TIGR00451 family)
MMYPNLLKTRRLVLYEGVEKFLYKGADLMWPGVENKDELGDFKESDIVAIENSNGELVAVGAYMCDSANIPSNGKAVLNLTFLNDFLWALGC